MVCDTAVIWLVSTLRASCRAAVVLAMVSGTGNSSAEVEMIDYKGLALSDRDFKFADETHSVPLLEGQPGEPYL